MAGSLDRAGPGTRHRHPARVPPARPRRRPRRPVVVAARSLFDGAWTATLFSHGQWLTTALTLVYFAGALPRRTAAPAPRPGERSVHRHRRRVFLLAGGGDVRVPSRQTSPFTSRRGTRSCSRRCFGSAATPACAATPGSGRARCTRPRRPTAPPGSSRGTTSTGGSASPSFRESSPWPASRACSGHVPARRVPRAGGNVPRVLVLAAGAARPFRADPQREPAERDRVVLLRPRRLVPHRVPAVAPPPACARAGAAQLGEERVEQGARGVRSSICQNITRRRPCSRM